MDELTQSEREQLKSWCNATPAAGFAARVVAARSAQRRRRFATVAATAVVAAAAVVIVLARPHDVSSSAEAVAPGVASSAATKPVTNAPAPPKPTEDLAVTLRLFSLIPHARTIRVFDHDSVSRIVLRLDTHDTRCASWSLRTMTLKTEPSVEDIALHPSPDDRSVLESDPVSFRRGTYELDITCSGAAESAVQSQTFQLVVTAWDEPKDPPSVVANLQPTVSFEMSYAYSRPRLAFDDVDASRKFTVYNTTIVSGRKSRRIEGSWLRTNSGHDELDLDDDGLFEVYADNASKLVGTVEVRRDETAPHLRVKTVTSRPELGLDIKWQMASDGWTELATDSPRGRPSCTDCRYAYLLFQSSDLPLVRAYTNPKFGDQYYVIR